MAEHEHIPEIATAALAQYLLRKQEAIASTCGPSCMCSTTSCERTPTLCKAGES